MLATWLLEAPDDDFKHNARTLGSGIQTESIIAGRMVTFDQLLSLWTWEQIPNCPGRYRLRGGASALKVQDLLGFEVELQTFVVARARDVVVVARAADFGIISYKRSDGSYIHTLNTPSGFERKLLSLGIGSGGDEG